MPELNVIAGGIFTDCLKSKYQENKCSFVRSSHGGTAGKHQFPELFALSGSGELGPALILSSLAEKSFGLEQSISDLSMHSTHLCQVKMQVLIRR